MNPLPRKILCELVGRYGTSVADDPRRLQSLLLDLCGAHRRENLLLVNAAKEQVAKDLLGRSKSLPRQLLLQNLTKRLEDHLAITEKGARWAVESWALALGVISPTELAASKAKPAHLRPPGEAVPEGETGVHQTPVTPGDDASVRFPSPPKWAAWIGILAVLALGFVYLILQKPVPVKKETSKKTVATSPATSKEQGEPLVAPVPPPATEPLGKSKPPVPLANIRASASSKMCPIVAETFIKGEMRLLGGSIHDKWTDITTTARLMQGKESYRFYNLRGFLGTGVGSKPKHDVTEGPNFFGVKIFPAPQGEADQAIIGVGGQWNPLPRTPHLLATDLQPYKEAAAAILKSKGIINPKVKLTQVIRIDLRGDGVEEDLVTATNFANPESSDLRNGDYSMVFLQRNFFGKAENILVVGTFHPRVKENDFPPQEFKVNAVLDLNGDGIMEVVVGMRYYEGGSKYVFQLKDNTLKQILVCSWGL